MSAQITPTLVYTQGNRRPALSARWTNPDESPRNLTGETITLRILKPDGTVLLKPVAIIDAPNGLFQVTWNLGDLDQAGVYEATIEAVDGGGLPEDSQRFNIKVVAKF